MYLPPEAIEEFRRIWRDEYDEDIPYEQAEIVAERFLAGIRLILRYRDRSSQVDEGHSVSSATQKRRHR